MPCEQEQSYLIHICCKCYRAEHCQAFIAGLSHVVALSQTLIWVSWQTCSKTHVWKILLRSCKMIAELSWLLKLLVKFNLARLLECSEHYLCIKYSSGMGLLGILAHPHLGRGSMYWSWSIFWITDGWMGEIRVVPCAHSPHPRVGTPHWWVSRIIRCARTCTKGLAVLTVKRRTYAS